MLPSATVNPVNAVQKAKACGPMSMTEAGIVTDSRKPQPENACVPMCVTDSGMTRLCITEFWNALFPIARTGKPWMSAGIVTTVAVLSHPVIVTAPLAMV